MLLFVGEGMVYNMESVLPTAAAAGVIAVQRKVLSVIPLITTGAVVTHLDGVPLLCEQSS